MPQSAVACCLPSCEVAMGDTSLRSSVLEKPSHPHTQPHKWWHLRTKLCTLLPSPVWEEPSEPSRCSSMVGNTGKFRARPSYKRCIAESMYSDEKAGFEHAYERKKKEIYFHNAFLCSGDNFNLSCLEENIVVETLARAHTTDDRAGMEPRQLAALSVSQQPRQRLGAG